MERTDVHREPLIIAFLCTWCAYRAADLVGTTRRPYAASFRPIRVVCTGRVGSELILKALSAGADGVLIVGCHPGECHRVDGNLKALRRVTMVRELLRHSGISPERVEITWAGGSEGAVLAEAADRMTAALSTLSPLSRHPRCSGPVVPGRPVGFQGPRG